MSAEHEPIPLSALQHAVYCLRQAALIHLERLWEENRFTAEGHVLHVAADKPGGRRVRGVRRVTALAIGSPAPRASPASPISSSSTPRRRRDALPGRIQARQAEAASRRRGAALRAGALSRGDDRTGRARGRAVLCRDEAAGRGLLRRRSASIDR